MTVQPLKRPNYHANPPFCDVSASCLYGAVLVQQNICIFPRFSYFILAMERQLSACTVVDVDCSRRFRAEAEKDGASHLQFAYTVMWSHTLTVSGRDCQIFALFGPQFSGRCAIACRGM